MSVESNGNKVSVERIRNAVRAYGLQKQLASALGTSDANLSKIIDGQVPTVLRLLDALGLEVVEKGEIEKLRGLLKIYL